MAFADRLLGWLAASGPAAPLALFALVFAESGLLLFLPGEMAVLAGGALAASGQLLWREVAAAAVLGALAGDTTGFLLGRGPGRRRFLATGRFLLLRARHVRRVDEALARYGVPAVLLSRFLPVARVAGPFVFGLLGVAPSRFFPLDVASCLVWGLAFSGLGFLVGDAWSEFHHVAVRLLFVAAALVVAALVLARRWSRGHKHPGSPS